MRRRNRAEGTVQETLARYALYVETLRVCVFDWIPAFETVQKTSLGYAGGKPNPLNPPYQGDFPLNSPLIRGARGVKNDERWVSCTVSCAGTTEKRPQCNHANTVGAENFPPCFHIIGRMIISPYRIVCRIFNSQFSITHCRVIY